MTEREAASSSPDGNTLTSGKRLSSFFLGLGGLNILRARLPLQKATLLDRAAGLDAGDAAMVRMLRKAAALRLRSDASARTGARRARRVVGVVDRRGQVRDVLGNRVLRTDGARFHAVALTGLGHGVVARVEVLAVLEVLGEVVGAGGELAVEAEEALLLGGEGLEDRISLCS